jgi:uncharacterized membrane protein YidH (DUF202 family)
VPPDDPEDIDSGLARERTRLAWARTAIAFAAVGAAVLRKDPADGLIILVAAPLTYAIGQVAGRKAGPGRQSRRLAIVTASVIVTAVLAAIAALAGHSPANLDQLLPLHG